MELTICLIQLLEQEVIVFLNAIFVAPESFVTESGRPYPTASIMLGAVSTCMHAGQWYILSVPKSLGTFGFDACNYFDAIWVGNGDIVRTNAHELAISLMEV